MMRRGFGLITAMIILVVVSVLMTLMLVLSSTSVKQTTDIFFKEQAEILARSSMEYALLALSGHENNESCVENINVTYNTTHEMNLSLYYIYAGTTIPLCSPDHVLASGINTPESNLTTLIDVRVSVVAEKTGITEPIVIHRRTLQRP